MFFLIFRWRMIEQLFNLRRQQHEPFQQAQANSVHRQFARDSPALAPPMASATPAPAIPFRPVPSSPAPDSTPRNSLPSTDGIAGESHARPRYFRAARAAPSRSSPLEFRSTPPKS